jgi:hypothetical protein
MTEEAIQYTYASIITMTCIITLDLIVRKAIRLYRKRKANQMFLKELLEREIANGIYIGNDVYHVGSRFEIHPYNGIVHHCVITSIGSINMTLETEIKSYCISICDFQRFFRNQSFRKCPISTGPIKHIMKHKFV